jgi:hypothetical protein
VQFTYTSDGRASGECYAEFDNPEDVAKALKKHNSSMGSRYIEGRNKQVKKFLINNFSFHSWRN